jgi:hypothetical protein
MRVVMVWKDYTDYAREVTDWLGDFRRRTGKEVESLDPESRDGESFARAYGVVQYPTVLAVDGNGVEHQRWVGLPLPLIGEVGYYLL